MLDHECVALLGLLRSSEVISLIVLRGKVLRMPWCCAFSSIRASTILCLPTSGWRCISSIIKYQAAHSAILLGHTGSHCCGRDADYLPDLHAGAEWCLSYHLDREQITGFH